MSDGEQLTFPDDWQPKPKGGSPVEAGEIDPLVYDPDLPVWLLTHEAQRTDMVRACVNAANITNRRQQLARLIPHIQYEPDRPDHFRTTHQGEPVRFWCLDMVTDPDPEVVAILGFASGQAGR